jgi:hypothetical protein
MMPTRRTGWHRQTFDAVAFHQSYNFNERSVLCHADDILGHDLADLSPVGPDVFAGEPTWPKQQFEPAWALAFGSCLGAAQQIALCQDADDFTVTVHYRQHLAVPRRPYPVAPRRHCLAIFSGLTQRTGRQRATRF